MGFSCYTYKWVYVCTGFKQMNTRGRRAITLICHCDCTRPRSFTTITMTMITRICYHYHHRRYHHLH